MREELQAILQHKADYYRQYNRRNKYGVTQGDIDRMLDQQLGCCAICMEPLSGKFHVDHSHTTGKVRGLLCRHCNVVVLPGVESRHASAARAYLERGGAFKFSPVPDF